VNIVDDEQFVAPLSATDCFDRPIAYCSDEFVCELFARHIANARTRCALDEAPAKCLAQMRLSYSACAVQKQHLRCA
jgi:hypothetical protein